MTRGSAEVPAIIVPSERQTDTGHMREGVPVRSSRTAGRTNLDDRVVRRIVDVVAADLAPARIAADAFVHSGRGRHERGLNVDDCFAYTYAKSLDAPLLDKGNDFARTDIAAALP